MTVMFISLVIVHCIMQLYCILYCVCIGKNQQADPLSAPILPPTAVVTQQQADLSSSATWLLSVFHSHVPRTLSVLVPKEHTSPVVNPSAVVWPLSIVSMRISHLLSIPYLL